VTRLQIAKRAKCSCFIIEVRMEEEGLNSLEDSDLNDLSNYIVVVYNN